MHMPPIHTDRLVIRPFTIDDLDDVHRLLDIELGDAEFGSEDAKLREERQRWLQWTVLNYEQLASLYQPPYGDRAVVLRETNTLIGAVGYVPCLDAYSQLPALHDTHVPQGQRTAEFGLFYAISPAQQRRGYATEAVRAVIEFAFQELHLHRIIAATTYDNDGSIAVMHSLGMQIERNPFPDPPWLQVVGVLHNRVTNSTE